MGFNVEDGNGLANANSYASVQDYKDFAAYRAGFIIPTDDMDIMKALVTATGWIDTNFAMRFKGLPAFADQGLAHPRIGVVGPDGMQLPLGYMPPQLKKATCILAGSCVGGDPLYKNADGAARVIIEDSVGPLIKKYAAQAPTAITLERQFPEVQATLDPLLRTFGSLRIERA
jgi:hypothetical protein